MGKQFRKKLYGISVLGKKTTIIIIRLKINFELKKFPLEDFIVEIESGVKKEFSKIKI